MKKTKKSLFVSLVLFIGAMSLTMCDFFNTTYTVRFEVTGAAHTASSIHYSLGAGTAITVIHDVPLPWETIFTIDKDFSTRGFLSTFVNTTEGPVTVRIFLDGRELASRTTTHTATNAHVELSIPIN